VGDKECIDDECPSRAYGARLEGALPSKLESALSNRPRLYCSSGPAQATAAVNGGPETRAAWAGGRQMCNPTEAISLGRVACSDQLEVVRGQAIRCLHEPARVGIEVPVLECIHFRTHVLVNRPRHRKPDDLT
jgi:hypothetical protein